MSRSHRGDIGKQRSCTSQALILRLGLLWPLRKSHWRSLLTFCGWQESVCFCVCVLIFLFLCYSRMHNEMWKWEGAIQRERNKKKWRVLINQVKVQVVAAVAIFFLLHVSRHLTLPSSSLLISSSTQLSSGLSTVSDEVCRYLSSNRSWSKTCLCPCRQRD